MSPKPLTQNPALRDVVYRNQWREVFHGTLPESWEPTLKVSVVTAAFNSQTLPLTLASLAAQNYPEHLLEVIVVDDGSDEPVEIGKFAPKNTELIRVGKDEGWGRSNALRIAIDASDGDIIYWVDSDMILFADNVREHAKWAHFIPEAATIGHKGFVEEWDFTPEQVYDEVRSEEIRKHHDLATLHRHWSLEIFAETDDLNASSGRNYSTHMGACATVTRAIYEQTAGQRAELKLGDDTEIAYQLWQRGAVFIPVQSAQTYHLGRATVQDKSAEVAHFNDIHFAELMPIPRYRRKAENRQWKVPFVTVVVKTDRETAAYARQCVDRVLNQTESDVHVVLIGPWSDLHEGRRRVLADPDIELYLTREWYAHEGRVTLAEEDPGDVFPSPFRLDLPVTVALAPESLTRIMGIAFGQDLGVVNFVPPEGVEPSEPFRVTFSPAASRAARYVSGDTTFTEAMDAVWGLEWKPSDAVGAFDVRVVDPEQPVKRYDPAVIEDLKAQLRQVRTRAVARRQEASEVREKLRDVRDRAEITRAELRATRAELRATREALSKAQKVPPGSRLRRAALAARRRLSP